MLSISGLLTLPLVAESKVYNIERGKVGKKRGRSSFFMMACFPNKGRKRSVSNGLSAMALGSVLTTGGVAAGVQVAASAASQLKVFEETEPEDQVRLHAVDYTIANSNESPTYFLSKQKTWQSVLDSLVGGRKKESRVGISDMNNLFVT